MTMNEAQRVQFLATLGISDTPAVAPVEVPTAVQTVDPHTIPASEIEFDPADIAEFGDLEGIKFRQASDKLFAMYRSPKKDSDRHGLLHRRITEFLGKQRTLMKSGGFVKDKVKVTKEQREIAQFIAAAGLTMEDLAALVKPQEDACVESSAGTADSASGL
jgi:hypothetical protein